MKTSEGKLRWKEGQARGKLEERNEQVLNRNPYRKSKGVVDNENL